MSIDLDRINTATVINDDFTFEFTQWVANTVDTLNEIINDIEPNLSSFELTPTGANAVNASINSIYVPQSSAQTVYTLPMTTIDDVGSVIEIDGSGSGGWQILTNGSTIQVSSVPATASTSITSANRYDTIKIRLVSATNWVTVSKETTGFTIV
jgi:hypothetical protein